MSIRMVVICAGLAGLAGLVGCGAVQVSSVDVAVDLTCKAPAAGAAGISGERPNGESGAEAEAAKVSPAPVEAPTPRRGKPGTAANR